MELVGSLSAAECRVPAVRIESDVVRNAGKRLVVKTVRFAADNNGSERLTYRRTETYRTV